jgi:hypothetical protein
MSIIDELDPLSDRVYLAACELLKEKKEITINDLLDVTDFCESVIRTRMDLLAKFNKLGVAKGTGRRPSYYFLPSEDQIAQSNFGQGFDKIQNRMIVLEQQKSKLLKMLNTIEEFRQSQDELIADIKSLLSQNEFYVSEIRKLLEAIS